MNREIVKVNTEQQIEGKPTVNARELWTALESKQKFADWIGGRIEDGDFVENADFIVFHNFMKNPINSEFVGGRPSREYHLSLDMAKEISMLERNEKGKECRKYFIQVEKDWNSPERVISRAMGYLQVRNKELESKSLLLEERVKALEAQLEDNRQKVILAEDIARAHAELINKVDVLLESDDMGHGVNVLYKSRYSYNDNELFRIASGMLVSYHKEYGSGACVDKLQKIFPEISKTKASNIRRVYAEATEEEKDDILNGKVSIHSIYLKYKQNRTPPAHPSLL